MILLKKVLQIIVALSICSFTFNGFAADQAAKEELSPPGDEGPLTVEQLPPINDASLPPKAEPQNLSVEPQPPAPLTQLPTQPAGLSQS